MAKSRKPAIAALVAGLLALAPLAGVAGPIADQASQIESMLAAGQSDAAIKATQGLFDQVWNSVGTVGFTNALLVSEPSAGYGMFKPRVDAKYKKGESILVYAEPFGFGYGKTADGAFDMGFAIDLKVSTEAGEVLAEVPDVMQLDLTSGFRNKEFQANITYDLTGLEAGRYVLHTVFRDKNSDRSGAFDLTIEIAG